MQKRTHGGRRTTSHSGKMADRQTTRHLNSLAFIHSFMHSAYRSILTAFFHSVSYSFHFIHSVNLSPARPLRQPYRQLFIHEFSQKALQTAIHSYIPSVARSARPFTRRLGQLGERGHVHSIRWLRRHSGKRLTNIRAGRLINRPACQAHGQSGKQVSDRAGV